MIVTVSRIGFSNIAGFVCTGVMVSMLPNKKIVRTRGDLMFWAVDKVVRRETNVQIVARRNVKKQLFSK